MIIAKFLVLLFDFGFGDNEPSQNVATMGSGWMEGGTNVTTKA
jgi:hypothetical protein